MPEFRQNPATKEWIILAPERGGRPKDLDTTTSSRMALPEYKPDCPFCRGNGAMTTEPILELPSSEDWQVRVVPNKFAALERGLDPTRKWRGRFLAAEGYGVADVLVEHPSHNVSPAQMTDGEVELFLRACRLRQDQINDDERINLVTIFRNHGAAAGTSLEHPHSQIIATPIVPPHVRYPIQQAVQHYDKYGSCVYCNMVNEEVEQADRILFQTEHFTAFCPYASRSPYECRIYPRRHVASYLSTDEELADLASVLRSSLARLYNALGDPDYNYLIRSAPVGDHDSRHLHWYMVIIPKISIRAGFEIGTGIYINTVAPEDAARVLREASDRVG